MILANNIRNGIRMFFFSHNLYWLFLKISTKDEIKKLDEALKLIAEMRKQ